MQYSYKSMTNHDHQLQIKALSCARGEQVLFSHVNLVLQSQEALLVIGPNGCGKTSLLRQLCGLDSLLQGEIFWDQQPILKNKAHYYQQLLYISCQTSLKPYLTVEENLALDMTLRTAVDKALINRALDHLGLAAHKNKLAVVLSTGQGRRLALARLLLFPVPLWILDEPLAGLDEYALHLVEELIIHQVTAGGMVIMTSHQPLALHNVTVKRLLL